MKLRQLNDLILELDNPNPYKVASVGSIIFNRLRELLVDGTIVGVDKFVSLLRHDIKYTSNVIDYGEYSWTWTTHENPPKEVIESKIRNLKASIKHAKNKVKSWKKLPKW